LNEDTKYLIKCLSISMIATILVLFFITCIRINTVSGMSMYPTILNNEVCVCLTQFYPSNLTNRIVVFQYNETINTLHRVIMDNGTHILTKGDNNCCPDGWFSKDRLIGWLIWHTTQALPLPNCPTCP